MHPHRWFLIAWLGLASFQSLGAATLGVRYSGRLVDGSGAPRSGPLAIEASFFRAASGGGPVGATQSFSDVALADGVFELPLTFSPGEFHALFADDQPVWIELKDATHGLTLPRQRLEAAPYARKVPVDGVTLSFDSDGKLTVGTIAASQVTGLSAALGDKVATSDLTTQLAGKADAAATTTALAGKADGAATTAALAGKADATHSHTLAGDVSGDVAATVVTKLRGLPIGTTAPSSAGQVLKWDGSKWAPGPDDGGASGVITNGASLGGGEEIFKDVSAPDMRFRTLTAGTNASVATVGDTIAIGTTPGLTTSAQGGVVLAPYDVNAGDTGELRFQELAAGGGNYVGFKAPDALAGDVTYTLPAAAPASDGQVLSGTTAGGLSWVTLPGSLPPSGSAGGDLSGSYPNPGIAANAVDTAELNDSAVTSAKIAADTITAADIAADAVTASEIAAGAVGGSELAADAVTSAKIQDGQVQTADLAASAVTTAEIADGTIANADIAAAAAVARSKLAAGTADHVLINNGSGVMTSEAQLAASRGGTGISSTATFPAAGVIATRDATEALTNKTLGSTNTLTGAAAASFTNGAATVTLPTATGTLATLAGTETLTNKTLTSPTINGGSMSVALGAVGAPSYAFTGDADTGAWSSGADTWNLSTAGAERVRVTSAGNVGIGTTSPATKLDVNGGINLPDNYGISFGGAGSNTYYSGNNGSHYLQFVTSSLERMRVDASGNVGIGTTSPTAPLQVRTGADKNISVISDYIGMGSGVVVSSINDANNANAGLGFVASKFSLMNGNVGIGTSSPLKKLTVGTDDGSSSVVNIWNNGSIGRIDAVDPGSPTTGRWLSINPTGGNVGIGTTNPGYKLDVSGNARYVGSVGNTILDGTGARIQFTRPAANYITATDASGTLNLGAGGSEGLLNVLANGNVGIGVSGPVAKLEVGNSPAIAADSATSYFGTWSHVSLNESFNYTGTIYGTLGRVATGASQSGAVTGALGLQGDVYHGGTGIMTTALGGTFAINNTSTGTITIARGVNTGVSNTGGGSITNGYGVYVGNVQATNKWSVYAADSSANSYFAGNVGIGTTSPSTALQVAGTATLQALAGAWDNTASGYVRLGDLQIAWGSITGISHATATGSVYYGSTGSTGFPVAFKAGTIPTTHISAQNYNSDGLIGCQPYAVTAAAVGAICYASVSSGTTGTLRYLAIGPWQ